MGDLEHGITALSTDFAGLIRDAVGPAKVTTAPAIRGALTGVSTVSVSGAGGGVCVVSTTEAAPTVIARTGEPVAPFHCGIRERATITIHAEGATLARHEDFLVLEGYW